MSSQLINLAYCAFLMPVNFNYKHYMEIQEFMMSLLKWNL